MTPIKTLRTTIRIVRVPPSGSLEGFSLIPYRFSAGCLYDVPDNLAAVLLDWGYAEPAGRRVSRDRAADSPSD